MSTETDPEILEVFQTEAREVIGNIENDLVQLEEAESEETVNSLFRYFHTLKGSSGIAGLINVSDFTHELETLLDRVRSGELHVSSEMIDMLLASVDLLRVMIFGADDDVDIEEKKVEILDFITGSAVEQASERTTRHAKAEPAVRYYRITIRFREDIFEFGIDPLMILEDLASCCEILELKVDRSRLPDLDAIDPQKSYLGWLFVVKTTAPKGQMDGIFLFVKDDNDIEIDDISDTYTEDFTKNINEEKRLGDILVRRGLVSDDDITRILQEKRDDEKLGTVLVRKRLVSEADIRNALGVQTEVRKKIESSTIRVETSKLDNLLNLLGEIVIGQSSISRFAEELDDDTGYALKNSLYSLSRSTRQFQEELMAMRMIPVGPTFNQFKRFVRDTAKDLGKDIRLVIQGKETELDKTVIEEITDPLKHMIRNSIDHGIEKTEVRLAHGKQAEGTITLNAYHQEGSVFIEVIDDGGGVKTDKIREIAIERGLLPRDKEVTEEELYGYMFHPGFSTSGKVHGLSGRGVGMDVVKSNIDTLRGSVQVESKKGEGTTFRIKLPLTLAIIDGMLIQVGNHKYIIPLLSILESIQPKQEDVKTVKGKGEVVLVRNQYISLVRLYSYFSIEPEYTNPWEALVVVVESNGERLALMIDDLIGQQQTVIKSIDRFITRNRTVSGAAILGDGNVALILDVHGMLSEISTQRGQYAGNHS
ncbi:MAG: chemotaxis protein CheW [Spirochaetota bacterium]